MIKQDFILVQIERLAEKIAQYLEKREGNNFEAADRIKQECYRSFVTPDYIRQNDVEIIIGHLQEPGIIELIVTLLVEDEQSDRVIYQKARKLMDYVQQEDKTFSFERIELSERIDKLLD